MILDEQGNMERKKLRAKEENRDEIRRSGCWLSGVFMD